MIIRDKKVFVLLCLLLLSSCKTINVTVIAAGDVEILIDQRGSDVTSDLKARFIP